MNYLMLVSGRWHAVLKFAQEMHLVLLPWKKRKHGHLASTGHSSIFTPILPYVCMTVVHVGPYDMTAYYQRPYIIEMVHSYTPFPLRVAPSPSNNMYCS